MNAQLAKMYGVLIAALAVSGLFTSGHLFGGVNSDPAVDLLRVLLAGILLYAGFVSRDYRVVDMALLGTGLLYIGMGALALVNSTLGGILPSGLTGFDVGSHLIAGAVAAWAGTRHHEHLAARS